MIEIKLSESEARELIAAARDMCSLWLDKMEAIESSFGSNAAAKIFYDDGYKTAFFHAFKLSVIGARIEDSLKRE